MVSRHDRARIQRARDDEARIEMLRAKGKKVEWKGLKSDGSKEKKEVDKK